MKTFEEHVEKITTVLKSYDEDIIKEAIEKSHLLDLKNLSEEDFEKTVMFFMERVKTPNTAPIIFDEQNEHLMKMSRTLGMASSGTCEFGHPVKSKKQPDYRKFEKNKRF